MRVRLILFVLLVTTASAVAQTDTAAPQPPSDDRAVTVMWAPLRAIFGLAEFTGEYRVHDKVGVSLMLGGGRRTEEFENMVRMSGTELEGGLQGRYYLLGSFTHGMELGAELQEEYVKFDEPLPPNVAAVAAGGMTVGAFAGYKIATRIGFTFEGQLGARYLVMEPQAQGVGMPMITQSKWMPMLHLNAGWTF